MSVLWPSCMALVLVILLLSHRTLEAAEVSSCNGTLCSNQTESSTASSEKTSTTLAVSSSTPPSAVTGKALAVSSSLPPSAVTGKALAVSSSSPPSAVTGKARALHEPPLDDVSMDHEPNRTQCIEGSMTEKGCTEMCRCTGGDLLCTPRCMPPLMSRGMSKDHHCQERDIAGDSCCVTVVCHQGTTESTMNVTTDMANDKIKGCSYKNETYQKGETFNDACEAVCSCEETGNVSCKPRCPAVTNTTSDRCVALPDPSDPCCTVVLCDVTLDDTQDDVHKAHSSAAGDAGSEAAASVHVAAAIVLNSTTVKLSLVDKKQEEKKLIAESSLDHVKWSSNGAHGLIVGGLTPGKTYYFRVNLGGVSRSNIVSTMLPLVNNKTNMCEYKGKNYTIDEEFHDGCAAYCVCGKSGVECASIECPTDFGLDVLDPDCVSWETPPDFTPLPPHCCPETIKCKSNGSCIFHGERFPNWADIPSKLSGCEQRCYCEMGNVTCHAVCPPVQASPPAQLPCAPRQAILAHPPGDDCCLYWMCPPHPDYNNQHLPHGFPTNPAQDPNEIRVHTLEAVSDTAVRLIFSVPNVLVGLHGRVELRYTADKKNLDPSTWEQQVLAPPDDLIATAELEFELAGLEPDTTYKIRIAMVLRDLANSPASKILTVKTLPGQPATTLPPVIPVDAELRVLEVNATLAKLAWRKFTDFELQFIDGVQLRYKEPHGKVYAATPLIHRAVTTYTLEDLKPESQYEVGIFFIPFPGQTTELQSQHMLSMSTSIENDPYRFELLLEVHHIKASTVELSWTGVPYPEDKYVNIYRAIYQSEGGREDHSTFKIAKRDSPTGTLIQGLKPETRYRLWLEAYLTNGRIKKSNVKDFTTKLGVVSAADLHQGKLEGMPLVGSSDYYGALVGVSILAALAIVATLILLLILARKHGHNKAPITAANHRKAQSAAYDNPSYKVEIQQETMDL